LGVGIQTLTPDLAKAMGVGSNEGAIVVSVNDGSPAKKAGLQQDDVVVAIDGQKVPTRDALTRTVALKRPGSTSTLTVMRGGKKMDLKVVLGTRPRDDGLAEEVPQGSDEETRRYRIGMAFQDVDPAYAQSTGVPSQGALITDVIPGSPAERADLQRGMVVVEANRKPVRTAADLKKVLSAAKSGDTVLLRVQVPGGDGGLRALTLP